MTSGYQRSKARKWVDHPAIVGKLGWVYCVKKRKQAAEVPSAFGVFCGACEERLHV